MESTQLSPASSDGDSLYGVFNFPPIEDDELLKATCKVLETGQLTPIIKQELKCVIQCRRLADGKEELSINLTPRSCSKRELTQEETIKRERRREQNRVAAKKFRKNIKNKRMKIDEERDLLIKSNAKLKESVERLENERNAMLQKLCKLLYPQNPDVTPATSSGYQEDTHSGDAD